MHKGFYKNLFKITVFPSLWLNTIYNYFIKYLIKKIFFYYFILYFCVFILYKLFVIIMIKNKQ